MNLPELPDFRDVVCFSVDVEWAHPVVLDDLRQMFDQAGVPATFFCTHAGVEVPGHERGLHPNFRRDGDTMKAIRQQRGAGFEQLTDDDIIRAVIQTTRGFCPEAKGLRAHSLFYASEALPIYRVCGLEYDTSYLMPLVQGQRPFWKENNFLEIPTYYMDHFEIMTHATGLRVENLALDQAGLKVFCFHPNMVYTNAPTSEFYLQTKVHYHDPAALADLRYRGRGARTFLLELLNKVRGGGRRVMTLGQVNDDCRAASG